MSESGVGITADDYNHVIPVSHIFQFGLELEAVMGRRALPVYFQ